MKTLSPILRGSVLFGLLLSNQPRANDLLPGTMGQFDAAARELFADPSGVITITSVTFTADGALACPPHLPEETQFAIASGFAARGGFALANGYIEDIDDDGPGLGLDSGCFTPGGDIGPSGADCNGLDPVLSALLGGAGTEDAAVLEVSFDVAQATTIDVSYNFLTFEDPATTTLFADVFGIVLDGALVAGGATNTGPSAGDPWFLMPSGSSPSEYQSSTLSGLHMHPAFETGRRTVTVALDVGPHTLSFHVADSGPPTLCSGGADPVVHSALFAGLHTFQGPNPAGVGSNGAFAPTIDHVGHPSPAFIHGGTFPADFQVTLTGAAPLAPVFLVRGNGVLPPVTIPLFNGHEVLVGPGITLFPLSTDGAGQAAFPNIPIEITATIVGERIHFQWFGLDSAGVFNTKGLRVDFGL